MKPYEAAIIADSVNPVGCRITTVVACFPRFILAEVNTHGILAKSSASSRAIPVEKRIRMVREMPFIPDAVGKNRPGMASTETLDEASADECRRIWTSAMDSALASASEMARLGAHKQWANRLVEPFAWHETILTGTEWENFFNLRISEHAQPEFRLIAEAIKAAMEASRPKSLKAGEWHLPYVDGNDKCDICDGLGYWPNSASVIRAGCTVNSACHRCLGTGKIGGGFSTSVGCKISSARCARVSYLTHDGKRDVAADIALHDKLMESGHLSPFDHPAIARSDDSFNGRFRGFTAYRKTIPGEADIIGFRRQLKATKEAKSGGSHE